LGAGVGIRARMRDASLQLWRRSPGPALAARLGASRGYLWSPRLPAAYLFVRTAHSVLAAGLLSLALALVLPWGTNKVGEVLYLSDFTSPRLAQSGVPVAGWALHAASALLLWALGLAAVLILGNIAATALNAAAFRADLPGCVAALLTPLIWIAGFLLLLDAVLAAGFGLLALLSQLPGLYSAGLSNAAATAPAGGFYLWWLGILLAFGGAIGAMGMRRRVL
jgi:hypothetical protein